MNNFLNPDGLIIIRILFFILYKLLNRIFSCVFFKVVGVILYIYILYIFFYFMLYKAPVDTSPVTEGVTLFLGNRKHVPCFYRVMETRVEVWENEKCCGFPQLFRVLPNFHECFYNSIETRSTCFLFLLENTATRKRKTTC